MLALMLAMMPVLALLFRPTYQHYTHRSTASLPKPTVGRPQPLRPRSLAASSAVSPAWTRTACRRWLLKKFPRKYPRQQLKANSPSPLPASRFEACTSGAITPQPCGPTFLEQRQRSTVAGCTWAVQCDGGPEKLPPKNCRIELTRGREVWRRRGGMSGFPQVLYRRYATGERGRERGRSVLISCMAVVV